MATNNNPQQSKPSTDVQQVANPQSKGQQNSSKGQGAAGQPQPNQIGPFIQQSGRRGIITEEYSDTGKLLKVTREIPAKKTKWDWFQLVIIPIILLLLGFYCNYSGPRISRGLAKGERTG